MKKSESFLQLTYAWYRLGTLLHVDKNTLDRLRQETWRGIITTEIAVIRVLLQWKKQHSCDAKLIILIEVLKSPEFYNIGGTEKSYFVLIIKTSYKN